MMKSWAAAVFLSLMSVAFAGGAAAAPVKTEHVEAELAPQTVTAAPGGTTYVALRQKIIPGWHTYWRNPGDTGLATTLEWTLPAGWKAGPIVWPAPGRYVLGSLMNYVYETEVYLPVPIEVPANARPGPATLKAKASWLVCKDICIPESADLTVVLPVAAATPAPNPKFGAAIAKTLVDAPKPSGLKATYGVGKDGIRLTVTGAGVKGADVRGAYFYPFEPGVVEHIQPQRAARGAEGLTLVIAADPEFKAAKADVSGVLALGPGKSFEITARPGAPLAGAEGITALASTEGTGGGGGEAATLGLKGGLVAALGLAFLGGLILNLMPCVFPILSMKAAALARHSEHPGQARALGLAFLAGVVLSFVGLAAALIAARAAGEAVGWGFQLQSPAVVAVLALVMLLAGLNLSGVFEVGLSAQGAGQGLAARGGLAGAFFTGVLAVVVAAPCTAPFMAGAIGWAFTQPPVVTLAVFTALGLGLAAPFVAVSFIPALFRRLPRPGAWMSRFRQVMAFPMYGAAAWLAWVFALQAGTPALAFLFAAAIVVAFAAWAWGASQGGGKVLVPRVAAVAGLLAAIPLVALGAGQKAAAPAASQTAEGPVAALPTEPWSPERVAALRAEGRPVFVDFTAAWCVTCQVNERTALAGKDVADAFARTRAVYLKADWTNPDPRIAKALSEQGRSGVPLYLVYAAKGDAAPKILPQLLTEGLVVEALEAAQG
jgi:thiol:disulfide interchange protein DsbD